MELRLALLATLLAAATATNLPGGIKPCKDDAKLNECVLKSSKNAIKNLLKGDPKYKIPVLTPLKIDRITINQGDRKNAFVNITMVNCNLYGLERSEMTKAEFDTKKRSIRCGYRLKSLFIISDYEMDGKFLLVPIQGKGKANITVDEVNFELLIKYTVEKRKGQEYMKIEKQEPKYDIKKTHFKLDNLFNGDKTLGEGVNRMLNENWQEITKRVGPTLGNAILAIPKNYLDQVTRAVPYRQIFPLK